MCASSFESLLLFVYLDYKKIQTNFDQIPLFISSTESLLKLFLFRSFYRKYDIPLFPVL